VERDTLLFIGEAYLFLAILFTLSYALQKWLAPPPDDFDSDWWDEAWHQEREFWKKEEERERWIHLEREAEEALRRYCDSLEEAEEALRRYWGSRE